MLYRTIIQNNFVSNAYSFFSCSLFIKYVFYLTNSLIPKKQNRTKNFFTSFFTKLAGTKILQNQIEEKISEKVIRASWEKGISTFKDIRKSYLLYQ